MKRKTREIGGDEELPHDVVEEILERVLEVKSLVRLRCVSKQWNSTIKSTSFASRHLIQAQSRDPHVVFISVEDKTKPSSYLCLWDIKSLDPFQRFHRFLESKSNRNLLITGSCDGLFCVYDFLHYVYVINPATRWSRTLPCAKIQEINQVRQTLDGGCYISNYVGFGKDTMTGKYKMVWFCDNPVKLDLQDVQTTSTCEVFDFDTNTWRYVMSPTHSIRDCLYLDGSLYWSTFGKLKIIRFDLHTEVFQELEQVLPMVDTSDLCCLNNRLCITGKTSDFNQEIWSLNSDKVWEKTYTINTSIHRFLLNSTNIRYYSEYPLIPVAVFNKTEMLLLYDYTDSPFFVIHDIRTGSSSLIQDSVLVHASSYFPSLISI